MARAGWEVGSAAKSADFVFFIEECSDCGGDGVRRELLDGVGECYCGIVEYRGGDE
jgi:hypothetical protein